MDTDTAGERPTEAPAAGPETGAAGGVGRSPGVRTRRWHLVWVAAGFVALFVLQAPGKLVADTKLDVVLSPLRFLADATHLWNSGSDFGFIPNQYNGYLFPMGPFFLVGHVVGLPAWLVQRLWMALVLTVAAWGVVRLADVLRVGGPGSRLLGGVGFALSPMFLGKIGATSAAMLGAALLPWMVVPLVRALRPDGAEGEVAAETRLSPRRAAALSGLAVLCTGGINAAVTAAVLLVPVVFLLLAGGSRRAWALRAWWLVAVVLATAWWAVGLLALSRYGLNFISFTETVDVTTAPASVTEALRGTADWQAYLRLPTAWLPAAADFAVSRVAIAGSAAVAAVSLWGLARRELPARRFLLATFGVGVVAVASGYVGTLGGPFADEVRTLLAGPLSPLRNVFKFQPVVHLPMALGLTHAMWVAGERIARRPAVADGASAMDSASTAGAVDAAGTVDAAGAAGDGLETGSAAPRFEKPPTLLLKRPGSGTARPAAVRPVESASASAGGPPTRGRWNGPRTTRAAAIVAVVVTVAALVAGSAPMFDGKSLQAGSFTEVPEYWSEAADWLAANPEGGRTLALPARAFAEYSWGRPLDDPMQWLASTPWGGRSLIPLGGVGVTRWMDSVEQALSLGDGAGLAAALARAGVGQVLVRNDLENNDWDIPPSTSQIRRTLEGSGLREAVSFGPQVKGRLGSRERALPASRQRQVGTVPALEVWTVPGGASMVAAYSASDALVVSGGAEATVQLAAHGLLRADQAVILAEDLTSGPAGTDAGADTAPTDATAAADVLTPTTGLAVTDTFDRRDYEFGVVHGSASYLLGADENVAGESTPPDQWTDRPPDGHQTVAGYLGGKSVSASSYGYRLRAVPELAPASAVDGLPYTWWMAQPDPKAGSEGAWLRVDVASAVSVPYLEVQLLAETSKRPVPRMIRVTTAGGSVDTAVSATEQAQHLAVPPGKSSWYQVTLLDVAHNNADVQGAGIRELTVPGQPIQRYAQVPDDTSRLFRQSVDGPVMFAFDRERDDITQPFSSSEEQSIARRFDTPRAGRFTMTGTITAVPSNTASTDDRPFVFDCGRGPVLTIDGTAFQVRVEGKVRDLATGRPVRFTVCTPDGAVPLSAGKHLLSVPHRDSTLLVDTISLVSAGTGQPAAAARTTSVGEWTPERREVEVGPGGEGFLAVRENANRAWTATLNGVALTPVRLDGWQQGWIVPAGPGGTVVIENGPGRTYRTGLAVGLGLALLLVAAALVPGRFRLRRSSDQDGYPRFLDPRRGLFALAGRLRYWWVAAVAGMIAVLFVAGPVALVVPLLIVAARRRAGVLPWVAAAGMAVAGVVMLVTPDGSPRTGVGAFSGWSQAAGAVAFAATLAALAARPARRAGPATQPASEPTRPAALEPAQSVAPELTQSVAPEPTSPAAAEPTAVAAPDHEPPAASAGRVGDDP